MSPDGCIREVLGWCLDRVACVQISERALEEALIHRFGTKYALKGFTLRHDNWVVSCSRRNRGLLRDNGLKHENITPYNAKQNGLWE